MADILWCCHVRGPDDVYAAPDYETALKWSDMINAARGPEPLAGAVPAPWPWSPEAHAKEMPISVAEFSMPGFLGSF